MESVKTIKSHSFKKGSCTLSLSWGRVIDQNGTIEYGDEYQRWMIRCDHNPMPIRNGTWFQGFSFATMCDWFLKDGWTYQGYTITDTGMMHPAAKFRSHEQQKSSEPVEDWDY